MPEMGNRVRWSVICLISGVLLILQGVFRLDWIVLVLVSLPLMLLTPTRDKAHQWPLRKKVLVSAVTMAAIAVICLLSWLAGGSIEEAARVVVIAVGAGLVLIGLGLLLRAPA
jgi:hypothetical protein